MEYEAVIGLEVHVQIRTASKMFCACANQYGAAPNASVCPVCLGYPGVLPVMNREAVRKTIVAGLMCGCSIPSHSKFDRKNYFYPDMPKDYQISQFDLPLCCGGAVDVGGEGFSGAPLPEKRIGLTRIHLEEDTAKLTHMGASSAVDFNRAGVPLMEIVSEPDMRSADEAHAYLTAIKQIMQYAGVSDCDMEKGQMRCDVNISVRPVGQTELGEKIEIKNLNSTRAIHRAIGYEIGRQIDAVEDGEPLRQETRRWDDEAGFTSVMRTKEDAHDYRYFPEPDLMPVNVGEEWLTEIRADLPESPQQRRERFVTDYGITEYDAQVLTDDKPLADYYEEAATGSANAKSVANWIMTELLRGLSDRELAIAESPVPAAHMAQLIGLIEDNTISGKIAKAVFAEMLESGKEPKAIVKEKGLVQVTDTAAIDGFVEQAISDNPSVVEDYRGGKKQALQFLVGQVMKFSRGKANPQLAIQALKQRLDG
ncbi:MAG: Asp-tRNA(Asn)/Glu-tRNA(Gln) amidotransferase subunit GatB [Lentisphaerae bacterium]|jgi:aspartyl-tRNA(Asn)/glutamyl-tRNA(Gln) amidotransferase subunit B|nr:Asp-tRNA(Asn)/Glu-tRNA(Gln) amidotransferase subunit GatB [Lentisphaerota bacterium]MBT4814380.1 Asp-tRNA(Asn)/Glu-tRNA(Gln) amidotransferase subunit GatB [Lentisphaerota bacterium]MBT5608928.1 Asp-tRNA(Asn)/Glu-tRNA(Gln) amidotransferase subunit GatB [Lentisphaerota bacterium]MBT7055587.1 Asp-tRNA(Asn)/Glu-tRNA(Gln) amidotransferase subunit GatB [Lentisphaerota bacterium]MBT7845546.1 Asp-tRNA(Asn)/Glu-tRNA(Gln) amidotransferase subunit GatB [Lentisphaerota bacterium]